jgi:hypothetical protein
VPAQVSSVREPAPSVSARVASPPAQVLPVQARVRRQRSKFLRRGLD